ncbi:MAG: PASTA domain-containing protein [Pseudonocardiaceae bacterium]
MRIVFVLVVLVLAGCADTATGGSPSTPPASRTTTSPTSAAPAMPQVVGMRLSEAKEMLSAQGYRSVEEDSTGQARPILEPLNWVVEAQLPAADAPAPQGTQVVLKVRKPTDGAGDATASPGTVPNVLCKDLQSAQDALQAADFYNLRSEDATGQDRQQLVDRNWVVVSQSVEPGAKPDTSTDIMLGAVKFGEPTGAAGCKS